MKIKNLRVNYGKKVIYDDFNLDIKSGEITVILGDSGCGKTTLIKAVLGLIPYGGEIEKDGTVSAVFQSDCLVNAITVKENILLVNKNADALKLLSLAGLSGLENSYPATLSGGMKRRVAICRALAFPSDILLLDEPFTSLDYKIKDAFYNILDIEYKKRGKTVVIITHDAYEAKSLADRIVIVKGGKIKADYKKQEIPSTEKLIEILKEN